VATPNSQLGCGRIDHGRDLRGELSDVFGKEDKAGKEAA
jgi:hypothetical protein